MTQILILLTAATTAVSMLFLQDNPYQLAVNIFAGLFLMVAGIIAFIALGAVGYRKTRVKHPTHNCSRAELGRSESTYWRIWPACCWFRFLPCCCRTAMWSPTFYWRLEFCPLGYVLIEAFRGTVVERHRLFVVLILTLFSMLFWAYFEQSGSSMNLFTDRNVDRVFEGRKITTEDVGTTIQFRIPLDTADEELRKLPPLTQEQLGEENSDTAMGTQIAAAIRELDGEKVPEEQLKPAVLDNYIKEVTSTTTLTISGLAALREAEKHEAEKLKKQKDEPDESRPAEANRFHTIPWKVAAQNVGMGIGGSEIVASMFQSANSLYILIFGLVFTAIWAFLSARGWSQVRRSNSRWAWRRSASDSSYCGTAQHIWQMRAAWFPCGACCSVSCSTRPAN